MKKIKAIILDSGGVIEIHNFNKIIYKISNLYKIDREKGDKIIRQITKKLNLNKSTLKKEVDELDKKSETSIGLKKFKKAYYSEVHYNKKILKQIKKEFGNMPIYLASNNWKENANILKKKIDFSIFEKIFFSYKLELAKPKKEFYLKMFKSIKKKPSECIIIDDKKRNLKSAKKLGAKIILFKNNNSCIKKIKKIL